VSTQCEHALHPAEDKLIIISSEIAEMIMSLNKFWVYFMRELIGNDEIETNTLIHRILV